jgi:hypothetical protein
MTEDYTTASPSTPTTTENQTSSPEATFLTESVPRGFHSAIEILNKLPEPLVDEMAYKVLLNVNRQTLGVEVDEIVHKLQFDFKFDLQQLLFQEQLRSQKLRTQLQRVQISDEQGVQERSVAQEIQNVLNVIAYLYKSAIRNQVNSSMFFKCIRKQTQMEPGFIKILQQHYHDQQSQNTKVAETFKLQRLKGMDWKLSVSMASFSCEQLNDAKVTLIFTLDKAGNEKHTVELSLEEFKQFYASFAEMADLLQTL